MSFFQTFVNYAKMVKFSHTLFALPFAGLSVVLALLETPHTGQELIKRILLVLVCMVSARNAAMGFNRLVDEVYDKKNPRTANRELPSGILKKSSVKNFTIFFSLVFLISCYFISLQIFFLSFLALGIILFYSYTKRFTWLCHYILGLGIGIAPTGAWLSVNDKWNLVPILWSIGLMFHISGFDILYSTQDRDFDEKEGLHSIPVRFGISSALWIARFNHIFSTILLFLGGYFANLGWIYYIFLAIISLLFFVEHTLVSPTDLSKVPIAFFHINASISIILFLGIFLDKYSLILDAIRSKF
jgi:4-hydroxybenzoate polyprenyltransferase